MGNNNKTQSHGLETGLLSVEVMEKAEAHVSGCEGIGGGKPFRVSRPM